MGCESKEKSMSDIVYLDPEIANEGSSANNWAPGDWTIAPSVSDEEYQPDLDPPHINDYAAFKKHKHYRQYFRPYRYVPFPAWMYHSKHEPKIVKTRDEVLALGPEWSPTPLKLRVDMTGKSLPVKNDTQKLTEALVAGLLKAPGATVAPGGAVDAASIAAIVAAVMAAMPQMQQAAAPTALDPAKLMPTDVEGLRQFVESPKGEDEHPERDNIERKALLELAEKEGIKVDGRWSSQRLKKELGLE
jgi:hypothetical protein